MQSRNNLRSLLDSFANEPFGASFGLVPHETAEAIFSSRLAIASHHQIDSTFLHGGCIAAICEQTARFAAQTVLPPDREIATAEFRINYLAGASGQQLVCHAAVIAVGRYGLVVDATVFSGLHGSERLIASARSTIVLDTSAGLESLLDGPLSGDFAQSHAGIIVAPSGAHGGWVKENFSEGWRQFCGVQVSDAGYGKIDLRQPVKPTHRRSDGTVHPGVIATLADSAGGACAYSTVAAGDRLATLEYKLSYLQPRRAEVLSGRARIIKAGKTIMLSRADVVAHHGTSEELIATAFVSVTHVPGHEKLLRERQAAVVAMDSAAPAH